MRNVAAGHENRMCETGNNIAMEGGGGSCGVGGGGILIERGHSGSRDQRRGWVSRSVCANG